MGRSPCCEKVGLKKGPWTPEEDQKLLAYIEEHGHGSWRALPAKAGLQRCGKSCRLRWTNYLRPDIKRGKFNLQEEQTIIQLHALLGNRWSAIATHLPKRTDNEIKNYWNTHLKKRLTKMGIDPVTHKPKSDALSSADSHAKNAANLSHMAQWEGARLEAEARLVRDSKFRSSSANVAPPSPASLNSSSSTFFPTSAGPCLDVLRAWQGVWTTKSSKNAGVGINLESPTSTLSYSENNNNGMRVETAEEAADWKWSGKPMQVLDCGSGGDQKPGGFGLEPVTGLFGVIDSGWHPNESLKHEGSWNADYGEAFTEVLLEKYSDDNRGNSSSEGRANEPCNEESGGSGGRYENEEENKSYWNSILKLVNSTTVSGSPSLF